MPELSNRRSPVNVQARVPGNRVPGALYAAPTLRAQGNAGEVAQESLEAGVVTGGDIGTTVQGWDARLVAYGEGEILLPVQSITASASLLAGRSVVLADASSGAITLTLPAASGSSGRQVTVKKTDAGVNAVTVDGAGSETIDGATTYDLPAQNDYVTLLCDGSGWQVVSAT